MGRLARGFFAWRYKIGFCILLLASSTQMPYSLHPLHEWTLSHTRMQYIIFTGSTTVAVHPPFPYSGGKVEISFLPFVSSFAENWIRVGTWDCGSKPLRSLYRLSRCCQSNTCFRAKPRSRLVESWWSEDETGGKHHSKAGCGPVRMISAEPLLIIASDTTTTRVSLPVSVTRRKQQGLLFMQ